MTRPRIGLALGSGGARGWSHIGIIYSLIEAAIAPDIVCGTRLAGEPPHVLLVPRLRDIGVLEFNRVGFEKAGRGSEAESS